MDKHLLYFKEEKSPDCLKGYTSIRYVGDVILETSSDPECAKYCIENECDFITADKDAYDKIFAGLKEVKYIKIIRILEKERTENRPVYSLSFGKE